jgi:hypothetical protein
MTPSTSDQLREFLRVVGQQNIHPAATAASYSRWLEDREGFLVHAAGRAAASAPPEPLRLLSHSPEAAAAARAEREQKAQIIKPAPGGGVLRTAGGEPLTMANAHDTEYSRALQRGAQQERETKERLRRQAAENAARRAAAEAEVRDATPAKQPR